MPPVAAALVALVILGLMALLALPRKARGLTPIPTPGPVDPGALITVPAKYPYASIINRFSAKYGQPADLIAAVIKVESNFNPNAENLEDPGLDYDSSYGLMQVQLAVAQDFGKVKDYKHVTAAEIAWLKVPENNVNCGTWNLDRWLDRYPFDVALHMENVGEAGYNIYGRRNWPHVNKIKAAYNEYKNAG